jgi:hypothetical protein
MRVRIDESRQQRLARPVDDLSARERELPDAGNPAVANEDVRGVLHAGAVEHAHVLDQDIRPE